ncbi:RsfA family transcriptional regulator [Thalassobacillus sp. CUG 92003]|uniref:RsfA family transcriptional regulator n=1 Tax=Thalassobacillus sp. CUG 92003 TaxID=2736641 RepID=UPI0015E70871|nr:RsfA family transcriptional regulator [Thalassobacillus sp. CUG 92003]
METLRQDAWKEDEDLLLAETILRHIRQGKTQLEGFKEVADKLSRTPAACGFRWNATVRKDYQDAIAQAKKDRKNSNASRGELVESLSSGLHGAFSLDDAIFLLERMKTSQEEEKDLEKMENHIKNLQEEKAQLEDQVKQMKAAWEEVRKLMTWVDQRKTTLNR